MKRPGSAFDPLWYKDAIIYELHVRSFFDSNNDGKGDLRGLIDRLDYLQDLGVTCLWLLPFFPSPLHDDGYDIADYLNIHPDYGTMEDFDALVAAAHDRGLQIMIELVLNHTSDRHAWFQRARQAPAGSPERDFYVWSDSDQKYSGVRIIFTDTEKSNWTWDPVAKAYYWHRFFSHQPDLNFDNPQVVEEVLNVMRFWLDRGVDGLRLDAIPYLIERDGTNCENLPETHVLIKGIRREMDAGYANRVILAEANQWPADVRPYFGEGDECHMAFHFPLMPRIFMALRLEDRLPITEIMSQTPDIPATSQWGLFLRNHDELTLEMVSREERDYMYYAYGSDPRMRLNIGIRRRLAPLMDNNLRRIELLNSLLFSFPGTPILYYGDEIGMGDNIYLGDRNGVRTPMQWNSDRNAGFSRVTPERLFSPVVMDSIYGYQAVNVEAQQSDPSSLLQWMRKMIALRKLFHVFGRGSLEFLNPANRRVLAYLRRYEDEQVLCVANLSRFAQPVELDLSAFAGLRPVEMTGYVEFPVIGPGSYALTLGQYDFLWFELQTPVSPAESRSEADLLPADGGWETMLTGPSLHTLESDVLPRFLPRQRWFGGKARRIQRVTIADWCRIESTGAAAILVGVRYEDATEHYFLPLAMTFGAADAVPSQAVLCPVAANGRAGVLHDGAFDEATRSDFLAWIDQGRLIPTRYGEIRGAVRPAFAAARGEAGTPLPARPAAAEQSNTSIVYDDRLILKLFRRQEPGPNPEYEMGRYLFEHGRFPHVAAVAGSIDYVRGDERYALGVLQQFVPHRGDAWADACEQLDVYYERCRALPVPAAGDRAAVAELIRPSLDAARLLGERTAEMHLTLASATDDPAFAPEPLTAGDLETFVADLRSRAARALSMLKDNLPSLPDRAIEAAGRLLGQRRTLLQHVGQLGSHEIGGLKTRVHGDYHLGQVIRVEHDYVILDFEGEPARPLIERRSKQSPLKDVAGMVRSYSYAAWASLLEFADRRDEPLEQLEPWAQLWERAAAGEFLRGYHDRAAGAAFLPPNTDDCRLLLDAYALDKALYEVIYELNNRPGWVQIPLRSILAPLP